jgi:S-(hydroxymethyl)glutathione dehydrogenase/alcohol dehydrogenase
MEPLFFSGFDAKKKRNVGDYRPMKTTFSGAILQETSKPLVVLENIEIPTLQRGQVLTKLIYSGVCHSQLMEQKGLRGYDAYLPHFLGHEGVGTVIAVHPTVTKVSVGQKVILGWIKGSGLDAPGVKYPVGDGALINAGAVTTLNQFAVVAENRLTPLPDGIPDDIGVLFGCAFLTGAGIVKNEAKPKKDNSMVFLGLGGIGISALMMAKAMGVSNVIAADISESRLALAKEIGADHCFVANDRLKQNVFEVTGNAGADFAVESAGKSETIEIAFSLLSRYGKCYFASHPKKDDKICLDPYELICGKQILAHGAVAVSLKKISLTMRSYIGKGTCH